EFVDTGKHPKTGEVHHDVLFGGGLTKRPFLKDILPINLSDLTDIPVAGKPMNRKFLEKLAARYGVEFSDETSDDDLLQAVEEAEAASEEQEQERDEVENEDDAEREPVAASEIKRLAEANPAVQALVDRLAKVEASNHLASINIKLSELSTDKRAL